jgi:hypothetical protein
MAFCGRCGSRVEPGTAYCVGCGRPVGGGAVPGGEGSGEDAYGPPPERAPARHRGLVVGAVAVALVLVAAGGLALVRTGDDTGPGDTRAVSEDRRADEGGAAGDRRGDGGSPGDSGAPGEGGSDATGPTTPTTPEGAPTPTVTVTAAPPPAPAPPPVTVTAVPVPQGERPYPGSPMSTRIRATWSADVEWVQVTLTELGYWWVVVDGHFGPQTARAVRDFQRAQGLYVDGVVGPQTWTSLAALR